jgi:superfamily I DNA/RNA helicase
LQTVKPGDFYREYILAQIPEAGFSEDSVRELVASKWWEELLQGEQSRLTFGMIARLTELLLRQCPELNNALRSTYSHVFLDEFQDVTSWQYDFLRTAFLDANAVLTAVGDHRQSIMGWAGAIPKPFEDFESDFSATPQTLIRNYRSAPDLVDFQHNFAQLLDERSEKAESKQERQVDGDVCQVWTCPDTTAEAERIANYIEAKRENQDLDSGDFAIIVKQKSGDFTDSLQPSFEERNLKIRDESKLQDVQSQDLTDLFLSFLRLGSSGTPGAYWTRCCNFMEQIDSRGMGEDPEESRRIREQLAEFHDQLLQTMRQRVPNEEDELRSILQEILDFVGKSRIQGSYSAYRRERDFHYWFGELVDHLLPVLRKHDDWTDALDEFEGVNVTPVMTIHKSKGLEYHTVFFLAFEDSTWWTMTGDTEKDQSSESMRAFFVAFSRAEQRVIFTRCSGRSEWEDVDWLYDNLRQAGANFQQF